MAGKRIFQGSGGGKKGYSGFPVSSFLGLSDTPDSYAGAGAKFVTVKAGENGLEFTPLPPLAITDTFVVASQAAMLALTAERGDVAVRTDINQTFILSADDPTILANWVLLLVSPVHDMGGALHTADTIANVNTKLSDGSMITTRPGEINALPAKIAAIPNDLLIIEDSADSNNKKSINISSLPWLVKCYTKDVTHTDFQTAGLTNTINLFPGFPSGAFVLGARLKPGAAFLGGAISAYYLSLGIAGATDQLLSEYETLGIVVSDTEYAESFSFQSFAYAAAVDLKITARSVTANLNASTQGNAKIEVYYIPKGF